MSQEEREDMMREQFEQSVHQGQLSGQTGDTNAPKTLKYISNIEDDIDVPVETMNWLVNKVESTTKLSSEDVRSLEWVKEYATELATTMYPPEYGVRGHFRAYVADDTEKYEMPLSQKDKVNTEGAMETSKQASRRSEDGWATETSTRDTTESIMRDEREDNGGGGLLSRIRG